MKDAIVRIYSNDRSTLDLLPDLAEAASEAARTACSNKGCTLTCAAHEESARSSSHKIVARFACERSVDQPACIDTLADAAQTLDSSSDALSEVGAVMMLCPIHDGEEPSTTYIDLTRPN